MKDPLGSSTPDLIEAITAYKALRIGGQTFATLEHPRIYHQRECFVSPTMGTPWPEGEHKWDSECRCEPKLREGGCACGVNAFARRRDLLMSEYARSGVIAQLELTGSVRCYELGYRAERAKIVRVWSTVPGSHAVNIERVAREHGIEYAGLVRRPRNRDEILRSALWHLTRPLMARRGHRMMALMRAHQLTPEIIAQINRQAERSLPELLASLEQDQMTLQDEDSQG